MPNPAAEVESLVESVPSGYAYYMPTLSAFPVSIIRVDDVSADRRDRGDRLSYPPSFEELVRGMYFDTAYVVFFDGYGLRKYDGVWVSEAEAERFFPGISAYVLDPQYRNALDRFPHGRRYDAAANTWQR